jgi:hypothetical protein
LSAFANPALAARFFLGSAVSPKRLKIDMMWNTIRNHPELQQLLADPRNKSGLTSNTK